MTTKTAAQPEKFGGFEVICASDSYYCDGHGWLPVPKFWIGDLVDLHSHDIQDQTGRRKAKAAKPAKP